MTKSPILKDSLENDTRVPVLERDLLLKGGDWVSEAACNTLQQAATHCSHTATYCNMDMYIHIHIYIYIFKRPGIPRNLPICWSTYLYTVCCSAFAECYSFAVCRICHISISKTTNICGSLLICTLLIREYI